MDNQESVDFDFFETPRNPDSSPKTPSKQPFGKPPCAPKHDRASGDFKGNKDDYYSSDDSFCSDSDDEAPVVKQSAAKSRETQSKERVSPRGGKLENKRLSLSESESSSAYTNSDYSTDSYDELTPPKKEQIQVTIPKVQAWEEEAETRDHEKVRRRSPRESKSGNKRNHESRYSRKRSSSTESSESDSSQERYQSKSASKSKSSDRIQSAKPSRRKREGRKSTSNGSSYSNNSDITDVSPLESPEASPRGRRKGSKKRDNENGGHYVQYEDDAYSPEREPDIKLDSDKIDLSILMKCMSDIDREKQQRLKTNSRRVMFAPPNERTKQNYSFTMDRAKMIEKENQRLLKQIMQHINPGKQMPPASAPTRVPKKAVQPAIQRITPSAVNRQREQRRIESENMHILHRLHTIKPTPGMARTEQMKEFEKNASYGVPGKTLIVAGDTGRYHATRQRELHSSLGISQRSRPSSAKSNISAPGRRSRPSSAKSDISMRSNASVRSTASKRSTVSIRSNASMMSGGYMRKMSDGKADKRPLWDDRFSCS